MTNDARTDNSFASGYERVSNDGWTDALQADSQFSALDRTVYGLGAGVGAADYLPDFGIDQNLGEWQGAGELGSASAKCRANDESDGNEEESDPEGDDIRQAKKEKASPKEKKQDDSDEEGGNIRQAKKEKASSQESQHFESDPASGKMRQMKKEKAGS